MDAEARKRKLFEKAQANGQRRNREALLVALPELVSTPLAAADAVYFPEVDALIRRYLPVSEDGFGVNTVRPRSYVFREVAWPHEALALFKTSVAPPRIPKNAWLGLSHPNTFTFGDESYLIPDLPVFRVDAELAVNNIDRLWNEDEAFVSLVSTDLSYGVVITAYLGFIEGIRTPRERVFEIATWGG